MLSTYYVDDTKLILSGFTVKTLIWPSLKSFVTGAYDSCLLLNPYKIKLMIFGSRKMISKLPRFKLYLLGVQLIPEPSVRDLGITFDSFLSFD